MRKRIRGCVAALGVMALCGAAVRADDLASIEKKILKQWGKHRSMRAKVTESEGTEAQGSKAVRQGEGTYEFMRKGDDVLFRRETNSSWKVEAGGQNLKLDVTTLTVCDGRFEYTLSERMGMKTAMKIRPDPSGVANLKVFFETLRARHDLKLLDEEDVDGRGAYVIQASPKHAHAGQPYATATLYFSKDDGVLLKQEERGKDGKPVRTVSYGSLEFDVKIDPKRFEFKAPEGVVVQDLTKD